MLVGNKHPCEMLRGNAGKVQAGFNVLRARACINEQAGFSA
jgi:hypothetical protein